MDSIVSLKQIKKSAIFSRDKERTYRYALRRIWAESLPKVMFVGLNPSDADESNDDPTVRRCVKFVKGWEKYGGLIIGNLFKSARDTSHISSATQ